MRLLPRITLLLAVALIAAVAPAAAPARQGGGYRHFSAVESGSSVLTSVGGGSYRVKSQAHLRGKLIGNGRLAFDLVVTPKGGGVYESSGRFKITAANGDSFHGTSRGTVKLVGRVNPVTDLSKVTGGTGRFAHARGRLVTRGSATIESVDSSGAVHTHDEATCSGRLYLPKRGGGRTRH
jgi:hypothetical protein